MLLVLTQNTRSHIVAHLPPQTLARLAKTCKALRKELAVIHMLWDVTKDVADVLMKELRFPQVTRSVQEKGIELICDGAVVAALQIKPNAQCVTVTWRPCDDARGLAVFHFYAKDRAGGRLEYYVIPRTTPVQLWYKNEFLTADLRCAEGFVRVALFK